MGTKRNRNKAPKQTKEYVLHVLSNDPTTEKYDLMEMLHKSALFNTLAYMDALHFDSGDVVPLLCGLAEGPDGQVQAFPLARLLKAEEVKQYLAPDGHGAWE
jgi:hypothetical protein